MLFGILWDDLFLKHKKMENYSIKAWNLCYYILKVVALVNKF